MSARRMFMKMIPCRRPTGELTRNGKRRTRASDGVLYEQYFGPNYTVYNTDGTRWYRLELDLSAIRLAVANGGAK